MYVKVSMAHYSINRGKQRMELILENILHIQSLERNLTKHLLLAPNEQNKVLPPALHTLSKKKKCYVKPCKVSKFLMVIVLILEILFQWMIVFFMGLIHTLMQQLPLLAIRNCLPQNVRFVIIRLCLFFNSLCSKVVEPNSLD